jgi:hypothetical protein
VVTKLLSHVTHNARMHCHKRDLGLAYGMESNLGLGFFYSRF